MAATCVEVNPLIVMDCPCTLRMMLPLVVSTDCTEPVTETVLPVPVPFTPAHAVNIIINTKPTIQKPIPRRCCKMCCFIESLHIFLSDTFDLTIMSFLIYDYTLLFSCTLCFTAQYVCEVMHREGVCKGILLLQALLPAAAKPVAAKSPCKLPAAVMI